MTIRLRFLSLISLAILGCVMALASTQSMAAAAVAGIRSGGTLRYVFVGNQTSMAKAKLAALNKCRSQFGGSRRGGHCEIIMAGNGPAYWSVVHASNGEIGVALGDEEATAVQDAFVVCQRGGECAISTAQVWYDSGQRPGKRPPPPQAAQAPQPQCRIPTGQVVRMQTRCTNGDCVRTYENGCTVRFQAARCLDRETNSYVWRPNGCDDDS